MSLKQPSVMKTIHHPQLKVSDLTSSRRMFLRDRSADAHAMLDKCVGALDTHASYRRYVSGISAFRLPLEAELRPIVWPELFSGYTFQALAEHLVKEMSDLDLATPQLVPRETSPLTFEGLVGALYVLESSALGSRLLYRRAEALGMTDETLHSIIRKNELGIGHI